MNNDNGNKKEAPIIAICPICKKRFRDEDGTNHIITHFMIATPAEQKQLITFPLILCTTCGIYLHPFKILDELKKRLQGEGSQITQAPANVKLVK